MASEVVSSNHYGLITRERAEKFDLLGQLILNQREAIIVCGDDGIGKTTLFNTFKQNRESLWPICVLQGREILGFEQIKTLLVLTIQEHNTELLSLDLPLMLSFCEQRQQKVVLMIDDAAKLAEGIITTLTEYALQNPVLRIVFAFTREQLYAKKATDSVVEDCYFIEIPPLTLPQIAVFLQELSRHSETEPEEPVQEFDDKLLNKLYQGTGGIPGKIMADFPLLVATDKNKTFPPLRVFLLIGIVCLSGVLFYLHKHSRNTAELKSQITSVAVPENSAKPFIKPQVTVTARPSNELNSAVKTKLSAETTKVAELQETKPQPEYNADEQWALQQVAGHYTLQLMAAVKRQALVNILKQHPTLQSELKILPVKKNYVLLYGSFVNTKTAYAAVNSLPGEFKRAWPRKIDTVQQELKNRVDLLPKTKQLLLKP